jgi:signal transduction histidine kinase
MPADDPKARSDRDSTDASLRTERAKTDAAIAERRVRIEEQAEAVVDEARERADAVVAVAREKADEKLDATSAPPEVVAVDRAREDRALEEERLAEDAAWRRERVEQARVLAALLPLERAKTDLHLLTEREQADQALAHRDDFMGVVGHDLRNLLSGIAMSAAVVRRTAAGAPTTLGEMAKIERYVARMNRLLGDLIDVVSIEAGKLAVEPAAGDAARVLGEATDAFAAAAAEQGVTLVCEPSASLPAIFDHDRVLQVVANLVSNALRFTPRGGSITLRGAATGEGLLVEVTDTGTGIPGDMLEAVFERFRQVGMDRRGSGLGLYIARSIVETHGGRIWARSELGAGSTFAFTLPAPSP